MAATKESYMYCKVATTGAILSSVKPLPSIHKSVNEYDTMLDPEKSIFIKPQPCGIGLFDPIAHLLNTPKMTDVRLILHAHYLLSVSEIDGDIDTLSPSAIPS